MENGGTITEIWEEDNELSHTDMKIPEEEHIEI